MSQDLPNWRYGQECSYSWSCCALCYQCLTCISSAISYRVSKDDIAMHLPAQALTKSSDLTYPKAKGKLAQGAGCRSGQLCGLAPSTIRSSSILGRQDFTELLCTNIQWLRQAQSEYD